jgi:hypothetical protein
MDAEHLSRRTSGRVVSSEHEPSTLHADDTRPQKYSADEHEVCVQLAHDVDALTVRSEHRDVVDAQEHAHEVRVDQHQEAALLSVFEGEETIETPLASTIENADKGSRVDVLGVLLL